MDPAQAKKAQKALLAFGLIGSVMALIGVFLPWAFDATGTASGWDCASVWNFTSSPYLPFIGGILAIIGILGALGRVKIIGFLLPIGGILAVVGAFWGLGYRCLGMGGNQLHIWDHNNSDRRLAGHFRLNRFDRKMVC